ncbi:MAG: ATP-binding cassette domain-containing protein [Ignavibacteriaceae bacterium]|nr:ATP-binding cassette domain-containing protein [Ignavibacteriaceae bacterium]
MSEIILDIKNLGKSFLNDSGLKHIVLENINLHLVVSSDSGSIVSILAPFGSGKTTLLKIIAGIEKYEGVISLNNKVITSPSRKIIYIPEKHNFLPWLNVRQNIEFPETISEAKDKILSQKIDEVIHNVGLSGYEDFYPSDIYSGFQLRIALARAILIKPKIILMDDILRNLDGETRQEIVKLLKELTSQYKILFILSTTNITESIQLSNRIYLMTKNPGRIFKEINVFRDTGSINSEIITRYKDEIEMGFKAQGMFQPVLVSL